MFSFLKGGHDMQEHETSKQAVQVCLYCRQPCGTDMFSVEPMWCCSWCSAVCHMNCYHELHLEEGAATNGQPSRKQSCAIDRQQANHTSKESSSASQQAIKRHRSKSLDGRAASLNSEQNGSDSQEHVVHHKYVSILGCRCYTLSDHEKCLQ